MNAISLGQSFTLVIRTGENIKFCFQFLKIIKITLILLKVLINLIQTNVPSWEHLTGKLIKN